MIRVNEQVLEFTIFCVESLAEELNMSAKKIYKLLKFDTDVLDHYIIPCYEALHSQSKHYIVEELIEVLKEKGVSI
ncbi:MAG: hypothetical protein ACI8WT_004229 [Clostridium sp.]